MVEHRIKADLGGGDFGWLKARHHFKVTPDGNPVHRPFGAPVVWNDDEIAPGIGFPMHGYQNMQIVSYVLASGMPGDESALPIRADARVPGATLKGGQRLSSDCSGTRHAYLVPTLGAVNVNGERVEAGDGIAMTAEALLVVEALDDTEVVMVEVF
ncbi:pirin family protein [Pseudomonas botevensis]|uniref:pirin family protein n=1 Tax=Pseudomonas botevensis TaxID=2842352 RepID=UPI001C3DE985|nr:hypothetical protein [Pseudomonas botevensis]MBV4476876.1 hypothetical protein [Pseudomonas botevensis]